MLKEIEDYNLYDCRSTRELRNWRLVRAWESGVTPVGAQPVPWASTVEGGDPLALTLSACYRRRRQRRRCHLTALPARRNAIRCRRVRPDRDGSGGCAAIHLR